MSKASSTKNLTIFIAPNGFIEAHFTRTMTSVNIAWGVEEVTKMAKKIKAENKPVLIIVSASKVTSFGWAAQKAAVMAMRQVPYNRVAIYGPISLQILLNTLSHVADSYNGVRAFSNRIEALEWLRKDIIAK